MAETSKIEIALIGKQVPEVMAAIEPLYTLHHIYAESDPIAALKRVGPRIRAAASHGMTGLSAEQIDAMPNLEICVINGVGLETTDLDRCRKRGIVVTTTPVLYDDVADIAVGLALAFTRRIPEGDRFVRAGEWAKGPLGFGRKFTGMRSGILGLGRIGLEVASRLVAFKHEVAYYDPRKLDVPYKAYADPAKLARNVDMLVLCAAGGPKGKNPPIVNRAVLEALGPKGIFVNVARGWLVDEPAMIELLGTGALGGAALDVFYNEPDIPAALLKLDNVVVAPHVASRTTETVRAMAHNVIDNLASWFAGRGALTPVP